MRTTVRLDDQLLKEAKRIALESNRTLNEVIEDALREAFARSKVAKRQEKVGLPTFRGNGLQPGVKLDSNAELLELMEEFDGRPGR
jgi:Ribbon-helix-helix protein, copG family